MFFEVRLIIAMIEYFKIELFSISRKFREMRINPIFGFLFSTLVFIFASYSNFTHFYFPQYIYLASLIFTLQSRVNFEKSSFLEMIYGTSKNFKIRLIENGLICLPFFIGLVYQGYYLESFFVLIIPFIYAFFRFELFRIKKSSTPYFKYPFEFQIGFRKYILVLISLYLSVLVIDYSWLYEFSIISFLGMFALISTFYSSNIEDSSYLRIEVRSVQDFLFKKVLESLFLTLSLVLPMFLIITLKLGLNIEFIVFLILGMLFIGLVVLAKYASYPQEIGIVQGTIVAISVIFFPISLITFPIFYYKAILNIKHLFHYDHS
ncbi:hypothetical protein MM236_03240 [Belliella sp. DSM 107340]|uniref:ABC transporter permease n=1 Tax=Belliella calami TaxID=2923436 RepID=A0ABS9UK34_9BACT|nr:hypothetical protein [Belliella calami]MCH7396982.1 hypothetical protein [Belliella calami]